MYYAASTKGFYDPDINQVIPQDAVRISREEYVALLDGQASGKQIVPDNSGRPTLVEREGRP